MKNSNDNYLTIDFLSQRIKTNEDLENLNNILTMKGQTFNEKIDYVLKNNQISITTIIRLFNKSYPESEKIIKKLIEKNAIIKQDGIYKIISTSLLKQILMEEIL